MALHGSVLRVGAELYQRRRHVRVYYHQDLHCIKPDYIDLNMRHQAVRLHRAMNKIFVEFYIANKNIAKVYITVVFRRCRQKPRPRRDLRSPPPPTTRPAAAYDKTRRRRDLRSPPPPTTRPAAAVIFDHHRRLRQDPPPLQNRCRRRKIPTAAA
jgi:hypothetical protein